MADSADAYPILPVPLISRCASAFFLAFGSNDVTVGVVQHWSSGTLPGPKQ